MKNNNIDYNSLDLDSGRIAKLLLAGLRNPQNEKEQQLFKQMMDIINKGGIVDLPTLD